MNQKNLYNEVLVMYSMFLDVYRDNVEAFVQDTKDNYTYLSSVGTLIEEEHAPLTSEKFQEIVKHCRLHSLRDAEIILRDLGVFVRRIPTGGLYSIGSITFRSGQYYLNKKLKLLIGNRLVNIFSHSVIFIDNFVYDFILGINGVPLLEYIKFLYSLNKTLGMDPSGTNYVWYKGDNNYFKDIQILALCGVIGPTYEQFTQMREVNLQGENT